MRKFTWKGDVVVKTTPNSQGILSEYNGVSKQST